MCAGTHTEKIATEVRTTLIPGWSYTLRESGVNFEGADSPVAMVDSQNRQRTELTDNENFASRRPQTRHGAGGMDDAGIILYIEVRGTSPYQCKFAAPRAPGGPRRGLVGALVREGDCGGFAYGTRHSVHAARRRDDVYECELQPC
ncbi:hypothetical protein B0H16DRAFT_1463284 [Mycena metata]|uniref:Uncharacterized protein n=1 Tax=Mycena metata TaxID=1033252 RepID=A0AAD7IJM9_9AGAR|nr:hypothetical protein B0H16DRAFT_1463284 [Mycena metata]